MGFRCVALLGCFLCAAGAETTLKTDSKEGNCAKGILEMEDSILVGRSATRIKGWHLSEEEEEDSLAQTAEKSDASHADGAGAHSAIAAQLSLASAVLALSSGRAVTAGPGQLSAKHQEEFSRLDTNGDGTVSLEELRNFLRSVCQEPAAEAAFQEIDMDGDGRIDLEEFSVMMAEADLSATSEQEKVEAAKKMFSCWDKSGDGFINGEELRMAMASLGHEFTAEQIDAAIAQKDQDGDGRISEAEFLLLIAEHGQGGGGSVSVNVDAPSTARIDVRVNVGH